MERRILRTNIDEVSGKWEEALQICQSLKKELNARDDASRYLLRRVRDVMQRVSH